MSISGLRDLSPRYAERNATDTDKPLIQYGMEEADAGLAAFVLLPGVVACIEDHFDVVAWKVLLRAPVKKIEGIELIDQCSLLHGAPCGPLCHSYGQAYCW